MTDLLQKYMRMNQITASNNPIRALKSFIAEKKPLEKDMRTILSNMIT